ncbi:hypothetical protein NEDG_02212 [Nematocida displodere]|uniref:RING-type domain-containing protein n=1 Tax=Nematocida displodere TaxID=1805483 RepID=A0A177ED28_9MICR|nr:hypothetical protein NEDG_02212 [Nematocida displodere]
MMKSNHIRLVRTVCKKTLQCPVLWVSVFCVIVGCSMDLPLPEYIVSPYTEQTIAFFEKSGSERLPNQLETIQIAGKRHILKKQSQPMDIDFDIYTLESVPDQLTQGIEFNKLSILTTENRSINPAVLEKILRVFGTVNAEILSFHNRVTTASPDDLVQRFERSLAHHNDSETAAPLTRWVLNVKNLRVFSNTVLPIKQFQERVDLSQCQINLTLAGELELENLEVLDGFNARSIEVLILFYVKRLDSLDCKLFREGPLPSDLRIQSKSTLTPKISEEVARNMLANMWADLIIPMEVWVELFQPGEQPKHLTAEYLKITFSRGSSIPVPVVGMARATVGFLSIELANANSVPTPTDLENTLEWVSINFEGLKSFGVWAQDVPPALRDFVRNNQFEITSIPTLTSIRVCGIECMCGSNILCLSLEAWELFGCGKLGDELGQADLSQLSPEQQAMVMNREEMAADNDACHVCLCSADELRSSSPDTQISILDHPKHSVCCRCLDGMVKARGTVGPIMCPVCRQEHMLPLFKNQIERNTQGVFEVAILTPPLSSSLPVLTFPRAIQPELPAI